MLPIFWVSFWAGRKIFRGGRKIGGGGGGGKMFREGGGKKIVRGVKIF